MTFFSTPYPAVFVLIMLLLLAGGVLLLIFVGPGYGIVGIGIAAFFDWYIYKQLLRRLLRTSVTVDDAGVRFSLFGEESRALSWADVRLAGLAAAPHRFGRSVRYLFVVDRKLDQMLSFTAAYARFGEMVAVVRERASAFFDISLDADETLRHRLLRLALRDVSTNDDGIRFTLVGDETLSIAWGEVRLAGVAEDAVKRGSRARRLFVCQDLDERWMVVPEKYERFDELVAAVRARFGGAFHDLTLGTAEQLKDRLQSLLDKLPDAGAAAAKAAAGPSSSGSGPEHA
jgi:hypothetical protein